MLLVCHSIAVCGFVLLKPRMLKIEPVLLYLFDPNVKLQLVETEAKKDKKMSASSFKCMCACTIKSLKIRLMQINRLLMKLPIDERPQVLIFPAGIEQSAALEAVMQTLPELEDLERECQVYAHERHKDAHALNHITKWQHDRDS